MKKPTAVFIGDKETLRCAYTIETRAIIAQSAELLPFVWDGVTDCAEVRQAQLAFSTWGMPCLTEQAIRDCLPDLRVLFYAAGSVQAFARPFLACGVQVVSARAANAVPVAQTVVSEIVLACKGFFQTVHRGGVEWTERTVGTPYPGAYKTRIGVLGAGQIGSLVIRRLRELDMQPVVYDPYLTAEAAEDMGAEKADALQYVFSTCFVISNHMPDLQETRGLLDKTCFDCMGETAVFLNTGRGRQVVEADLIAALRDKPTRAAVLDVTYPEPPEQGSGLYTLPNVFLTPHLAGSVGNEVGRMGEQMAEELERLLRGEELRYAVTEDMLQTMA